MLLFFLLGGSALLALWAQQSPIAPEPISRFAPWAFLAFAIGFSAYRLALVVAKRYSPFKAFAQIVVAALFFMLLLFPRVVLPIDATPGSLLSDRDPKVRALAAEVVGWRQSVSEAPKLIGLLSGSTEAVRVAAHDALVRLNAGADLGVQPEAWKARYQ